MSESESPGRSALETGSKWEEESLIEFVGEQVSFGKPEAEFSGGLDLVWQCHGHHLGPRSLAQVSETATLKAHLTWYHVFQSPHSSFCWC